VTARGLTRRSLLAAAAAMAAALRAHRAPAAEPSSPAVALLVGNTSYNPGDDDLPPARRCLADLDAQLRRLGYSTRVLHDPTVADVGAELERMRRTVAAAPGTTAVFYFIGHGFQCGGENYLVPAGGDLESSPRELARRSLSVERDVFARLQRPAGPAATTILVDACRTLDGPPRPDEGHNQTMPPDGCHVAFATGPGQRAFAPADPQRHTFFADALVLELEQSTPGRSVLATLEVVRARVVNQVNGNDAIRAAFGENAQQPELASNVTGDPAWIAAAAPAAAAPEPAQAAAVERRRAEDRALAERAAAAAGLDVDAAAFAAGRPPRVAEDARRALAGDKYAALRVAEALPPPLAGELIERSDYGRWMAFAAYLGNGIAAYRLSLWFRNVDRRDAEAARYLRLARAAHYTPPPQLDPTR
jgi:hypothetical protein